jgi:hypothetical protein
MTAALASTATVEAFFKSAMRHPFLSDKSISLGVYATDSFPAGGANVHRFPDSATHGADAQWIQLLRLDSDLNVRAIQRFGSRAAGELRLSDRR